VQFKQKIITSLLVGGGIIATPLGTSANDSSELEQLRALVQELDQKIRVIERKDELAEEKAADDKKKNPVVKASEKGFGIESADGKNVIKLRGLLQADHRHYTEGTGDVRLRSNARAGDLDENGHPDAGDGSLLRRVRPTIEGKVAGKYGFRFTPEFAGGSASAVDAYVDANFSPALNFRAGKFKSFVGLERLQGGGNIKFMERSYVTNAILPNRDLGAAVYGSVFDNKVNYAFGIINGVADGGNISTGAEYNDEREFTARLFVSPFKDQDSALAGLGFGIGGTFTDFKGDRNLNYTDTSAADATRNGLPSYLTDGQNTFFRYSSSAVADGERFRFSPQANYYYGPFGLITEYAKVYQDVSLTTGGSASGGGSGGNTIFTPGTNKELSHDAWQIAGTWLLTGEEASFGSVKPKQDFDFDKGGWGAWELGLRYSEINLDSDTFKDKNGDYTKGYASLAESAESAESWTAAINWYWNENVKLALNYTQTKFDGGSAPSLEKVNASGSNVEDRPDEKAVFARFQVSY
jgi:phosphate-selective porin OprO/OprP